MATFIKTFTFDSSTQGFSHYTNDDSISGDFTSLGGNPGGAINTISFGKNSTQTSRWEWNGTWESLGLPLDSTITHIRLEGVDSRVGSSQGLIRAQFGPYTIMNSSSNILATLWSGRTNTVTEGSFVSTGTQTDQVVPSGFQSSNSTIKLYLYREISLSNIEIVSANLFEDNISFVITYDLLNINPTGILSTEQFSKPRFNPITDNFGGSNGSPWNPNNWETEVR